VAGCAKVFDSYHIFCCVTSKNESLSIVIECFILMLYIDPQEVVISTLQMHVTNIPPSFQKQNKRIRQDPHCAEICTYFMLLKIIQNKV